MRKYYRKSHRKSSAPIYNVIINRQAADYSEKRARQITDYLSQKRIKFYCHEPSSSEDTVRLVKWLIGKKPRGIIAGGGDGTVNLIGRHLIRRTIGLGIYPLGRFNNIYRSLYGDPDSDEAMAHIASGKTKRIDYAAAARYFFIGSLSIGLLPEMTELLKDRKPPRFSISWSRLASRAAAAVKVEATSIKVDAFGFQFTPQTISINLLGYTLGLTVTPASICDDGKGEITFDIGPNKAIMSSYIRRLNNHKYVYADDIRMFRGQKIALKPLLGRKLLIDGDLIECRYPELNIEVFPQRIRIMHHQGEKSR
jgi:diacylglycerol kinase family enzyme